MLTIGDQEAVSLVHFFDDLPDPRSRINRLHRLGDVIVIAICAVVATADGPTAIAQWAELNEAWLKTHLALPHGIPGKDTFRRVLSMLSPALFQQCFRAWIDGLTGSGEENVEAGEQRRIAIDGKTLRRSHDGKNGLGPLHVVSAWASDRGVTLGQVATDEKSNEITAIPAVADDSRPRGRCRHDRRGRLPEDHRRPDREGPRRLRAGAQRESRQALQRRSLGACSVPCRTTWRRARSVGTSRSNKGTGGSKCEHTIRSPPRTGSTAAPTGKVSRRSAWSFASAKRMASKRPTPVFTSAACAATANVSPRPSALIGEIENSLHWSLDMTYREDDSRVRNRTFAENLAWLRRFTLSLVKQHPGKQSQIMKRRMAGWSVDFLMAVWLTGVQGGGFRFQVSGFRFQVSGFRFSAAPTMATKGHENRS